MTGSLTTFAAQADIPFLEGDFACGFPHGLASALQTRVDALSLSVVNWPAEYPDFPQVTVRLAYGNEGIYLYYEVTEGAVVAKAVGYNGRVWEDSCVELFIDPLGDGSYYNLEVNCIGAPLLGKGEGRSGRVHTPDSDMQSIKTSSSLGTLPFDEREGPISWNMVVMVPYRLLQLKGPESLAGKEIRGNVYKCGDGLKSPHYVTWSRIGTPHPDYHRPEYFGTFHFLPPLSTHSKP